MTATEVPTRRPRDLLFFTTPALWPRWPFLPLVRRRASQPDDPELGVLYDAAGSSGTYGYSSTVFLANVFCLPAAEARLLALPRYVYDTPEEMAEAGWTVD
jgi:hypothetical protein